MIFPPGLAEIGDFANAETGCATEICFEAGGLALTQSSVRGFIPETAHGCLVA